MALTRPGKRNEAVVSPDSAAGESAMQTPGGPLQNRKSPRATTNLDNIGDERSPTDAPPPQNRRENAREGFDVLGDAADASAGASARAASSRTYRRIPGAKSKFSGNRILGGPDERVGTPPRAPLRVAHGTDRQAPPYGGSGD